jgi:calcineurin-like phosphoesterase family protein
MVKKSTGGETLIIGDCHLDDKYPAYLEFQINCLKQMIDTYTPKTTIFLGDLSDKRKPKPPVLLAIKDLLNYGSSNKIVIRGNHDSNSKADDGVTYLSLYESDTVKIITHYEELKVNGVNISFIPHYENEDRIIELLGKVPNRNLVLAHVGFSGAVNAVGDYDFNIGLDNFRNPTILGHIHKFVVRGNVTVLGTPYPTSFQELNSTPTLGLLSKTGKLKLVDSGSGIRYYQFELNSFLNSGFKQLSKDNYNIIRLLTSTDDESNTFDIVKKITNDYPVQWVDLKLVPKEFDKDNSVELKNLLPVFDEELIVNYIDNIKTLPFTKEELFTVYKELRSNEN